LKETKLSKELEGILGLSGLSRWDGVDMRAKLERGAWVER
jgi:hypothetical protein